MQKTVFLVTLFAFGTLAHADQPYEELITEGAPDGGSFGDPRSYASNSLLLPEDGYQVGATLSFMTSDAKASGQDYRFTDAVLLQPGLRWTIAEDLEFSTSLSLLTKQPASTDDALLQSMDLGVRTALTKNSAAWLRGFGGEMRDELGRHGGVNGGVEARKSIASYAAFQGALGGSYHELFFKEAQKDVWLSEILLSGKVLFMEPYGKVGAWIGTDFHVPVAGYPKQEFPDRMTGRYLNPQTRVNFRIGGVVSAVKNWDLFAEFVVVDRGEVEDMSTQLPILEGGFDQNHLIFGIQRRFVEDKAPMMMVW
jgi:hypothetical protein